MTSYSRSILPSAEYDHGFEPIQNNLVYTDQSAGTMVVKEYGFDGKSFFTQGFPVSNALGHHGMKPGWLILLSVQKQSCRFRGRNYMAWFCAGIPLPYGPWKMGGLPGLITELRDDQDNMMMSLVRISNTDKRFNVPSGVNYTMEEHIRDMKNFLKKLQGNARSAGSGDCLSCQTESAKIRVFHLGNNTPMNRRLFLLCLSSSFNALSTSFLSRF